MKLGVLSLWSGREAGGAATTPSSSAPDASRISALPEEHLPETEGASSLFDGRAAGSTRPPQKSGRFPRVTPEQLDLAR